MNKPWLDTAYQANWSHLFVFDTVNSRTHNRDTKVLINMSLMPRQEVMSQRSVQSHLNMFNRGYKCLGIKLILISTFVRGRTIDLMNKPWLDTAYQANWSHLLSIIVLVHAEQWDDLGLLYSLLWVRLFTVSNTNRCDQNWALGHHFLPWH
jgi:hypothetical protein